MSIRDSYFRNVERAQLRLSDIPMPRKRLAVGAIIFVLLLLIMSIEISPFGYLVQEGKPSPRKIVAPRTVQYLDKTRTEEERKAAAAAIGNVYVIDKSAFDKASRNIEDFFTKVDEINALPLTTPEKVSRLVENTGSALPASQLEALFNLSPDQRSAVKTSNLLIAKAVMEGLITPEKLDEAKEEARIAASNEPADKAVQELAAQTVASFVTANARLDRMETERRKKAARNAVNEVITTRLQGEVVVNKGQVVTREQVELLKSLGFRRSTFTPLNILYTAVMLILLLGAVSMFLAKYRPVYFDSPALLAVMGSMIVVFAAIAKVLTVASMSWSPFWGYLIPTAAIAIMVAVLFDTGLAIVLVFVCGMVTGLVTGGNFSLVAFSLLGGFFPALYVTRYTGRGELRWVGFYTAFWVALVAFGATALTQLNQGLIVNTAVGFLNGVLCTIIAMGSLPFLETTFRITTNNRLLELASPEQDLLKELSIKAPGTYSHSVMVANLAEAAAREAGSDPMMARVAAYYHDVGKMLRPQFFVENQPEHANAHEGLSPNLSTLIITSHVRDGVEMLQKAHLPPDLIDIIGQHHGTSIVKYFYLRAQEESDGETVDDNRFRYHFQKPQSRTAGILMLADSVEAAARPLDKPSAAAIEQTVERIVHGKLEDGQLDECRLTFSDVLKIKNAFARILIGVYHPRIAYPMEMTEFEKRNERSNIHRGSPSKEGNQKA
jgi:cyclic-di-AMP phosphodiesterase PgpH